MLLYMYISSFTDPINNNFYKILTAFVAISGTHEIVPPRNLEYAMLMAHINVKHIRLALSVCFILIKI